MKPLNCPAFFILLITSLICVGCSGQNKGSSENHSDARRTTHHEFLSTEANGNPVFGNNIVSIDCSNTTDGYVMVLYNGSADKAKLQIQYPDSTTYAYTLSVGAYSAFPLSGGNGGYHINILEHAYDNMYALAFSQDIDVTLSDELNPFLYPNQYVCFTSDSKALQLGIELSDNSSNDLDYVEQIYNYIIENITYDDELAANIPTDYIPDIDRTLESGKGVCFDYASLMAALLRSQGIPTKLVVGYSGTVYHAWISVYLTESGWVDNIIEFDGKNWSLIDPTLAATNSSSSVKKYIGDGSNYTVKYSY